MTMPSNSLARKQPDSLADVLERVLDKGIVIAGDIVVNVLDIELLSLKLRLFVASAETAREMGMDWWTHDPFFNSQAQQDSQAALDGKRPATARHDLADRDTDRESDRGPAAVTATDESNSGLDLDQLAAENAQLRRALEELREGGAAGGDDR